MQEFNPCIIPPPMLRVNAVRVFVGSCIGKNHRQTEEEMKSIQRRCRRFLHLAWPLILFAGCPLAVAAEEEPNRPNLTGTVLDETGQVLSNVTVFIYTAG